MKIEEWLLAGEYVLAHGNSNPCFMNAAFTFETYAQHARSLDHSDVKQNRTADVIDPSQGATVPTSLSPCARAPSRWVLTRCWWKFIRTQPSLERRAQQVTLEGFARLMEEPTPSCRRGPGIAGAVAGATAEPRRAHIIVGRIEACEVSSEIDFKPGSAAGWGSEAGAGAWTAESGTEVMDPIRDIGRAKRRFYGVTGTRQHRRSGSRLGVSGNRYSVASSLAITDQLAPCRLFPPFNARAWARPGRRDKGFLATR